MPPLKPYDDDGPAAPASVAAGAAAPGLSFASCSSYETPRLAARRAMLAALRPPVDPDAAAAGADEDEDDDEVEAEADAEGAYDEAAGAA